MDTYFPQLLQALVPILWVGSLLLIVVSCVGLALKWEPESFRLVTPE